MPLLPSPDLHVTAPLLRTLGRAPLWATLGLLGIVGCASGAGPSDRQEVAVHLLLQVDNDQHDAFVHWAFGPDSAFGLDQRPVPVAEGLVHLSVSNGLTTRPLVAVPNQAGRWLVSLAVSPGHVYRLSGTVAGRAIEAAVQAPGTLVVDEPIDDTVRVARPTLGDRSIPFAWKAAAAGGYQLLPSGVASAPSTDTVGFIDFFAVADTVPLRIVALDSAAFTYYSSPTTAHRRGNIGGGAGVFGALSEARRVFIFR